MRKFNALKLRELPSCMMLPLPVSEREKRGLNSSTLSLSEFLVGRLFDVRNRNLRDDKINCIKLASCHRLVSVGIFFFFATQFSIRISAPKSHFMNLCRLFS